VSLVRHLPTKSHRQKTRRLLELSRRHSSVTEESEKDECIKKEINIYFSLIAALNQTTGLEFWRKNCSQMPWWISALARYCLSIPATSAAGLIVTAKRSQLAPQRLSKILFLNDNYEIVMNAM